MKLLVLWLNWQKAVLSIFSFHYSYYLRYVISYLNIQEIAPQQLYLYYKDNRLLINIYVVKLSA